MEKPASNLSAYQYERESAKRDLTLIAYETPTNLYFIIEYCVKLFKEETIEKFIKYFKEIISIVLKDKNIKLGDIRVSHDFFDRKLNNPQIEFGFWNPADKPTRKKRRSAVRLDVQTVKNGLSNCSLGAGQRNWKKLSLPGAENGIKLC